MAVTNEGKSPRKKDVWQSFMTEGATWAACDIPNCPTTARRVPERLISWERAKAEYSRELRTGSPDYHTSAYVHFFHEDYRFDGPREGIWANPYRALAILSHYDGIITPDFSTYQDFPDPIKRVATLRMRAFGHFTSKEIGIGVINCVRWGDSETWEYCFNGIDTHSVVAVGTVASDLDDEANKRRFIAGARQMVARLFPHTIIVVGSARLEVFEEFRQTGIAILQFDGDTALYFKQRGPR